MDFQVARPRVFSLWGGPLSSPVECCWEPGTLRWGWSPDGCGGDESQLRDAGKGESSRESQSARQSAFGVHMAGRGDQCVPAGSMACALTSESPRDTWGTLHSGHCGLGAPQPLITWLKNGWDFQPWSSASIRGSNHLGEYSRLKLSWGRKLCNLFNYTSVYKHTV